MECLTGGPGICLFLQNKISTTNIAAGIIELKLALLNLCKCTTCGSVLISEQDISEKMKVAVPDFVRYTSCKGICNVPVSVSNITSSLEVSMFTESCQGYFTSELSHMDDEFGSLRTSKPLVSKPHHWDPLKESRLETNGYMYYLEHPKSNLPSTPPGQMRESSSGTITIPSRVRPTGKLPLTYSRTIDDFFTSQSQSSWDKKNRVNEAKALLSVSKMPMGLVCSGCRLLVTKWMNSRTHRLCSRVFFGKLD